MFLILKSPLEDKLQNITFTTREPADNVFRKKTLKPQAQFMSSVGLSS